MLGTRRSAAARESNRLLRPTSCLQNRDRNARHAFFQILAVDWILDRFRTAANVRFIVIGCRACFLASDNFLVRDEFFFVGR
jgi:hypothetical protein